MPIQIQTSFIPKKAPTFAPPTSGVGGRSVNIFAIIAFSVFFLIVGLSAGVFFYKSHLISSIESKDIALAAAKKSFEPAFVAKAVRLSSRIESARGLLNTHRALSPLFDILEEKTLKSVRFQDFNFSFTKEHEPSIVMTGQAKSFNSVALQSDVFGAEHSFKDPVFSNFNLNERGDVIFNFKTTIDPKLLLYREVLLNSKTEATKDVKEDFDISGQSSKNGTIE